MRFHRTWMTSDRYVPAQFVRPALRFMNTEAASGLVLLAAALVALIWANSAWSAGYFSFFDTRFILEFGPLHLEESFKDLINDGLMVIFFYVVGLEIKRELAVGELSRVRKAALPVMAAIGGMVVPAAIYLGVVLGMGGDGVEGWGIPMATDIAFSIGVVALLGTRVSSGAKLFLLALAIVDDIGAIAVIALFYSDGLHLGWLALAAALLVVMAAASRVGVRAAAFHVTLALVVWFAFLESGVHATIAGVILGLMTPVRPLYSDDEFRRGAALILDRWETDRRSSEAEERLDHDALELAAVARESVSPLDRMDHHLHLWSSFLIVPLFALANAGVRLVGMDVAEAVLSPVALGAALGLALGKPIGIAAAAWLGLRLRIGSLPEGATLGHIIGVGMLAGIGFTVALFIAELAFLEGELVDQAKIGIFLGSGIAGAAGFLALRSMLPAAAQRADAQEAPVAGGGE